MALLIIIIFGATFGDEEEEVVTMKAEDWTIPTGVRESEAEVTASPSAFLSFLSLLRRVDRFSTATEEVEAPDTPPLPTGLPLLPEAGNPSPPTFPRPQPSTPVEDDETEVKTREEEERT